MSRKTSIPRKIVLGDRGIQTYRSCDKGFAGSLRLTTFKEATDATIIRESEFAKPYGEQYEDPHEDYSAMEYQAPNMPPWGWDYPAMPGSSPWHVVFFCDGTFDICWCPEESVAFVLNCSFEIIGVEFDPPWNEVGVSFDKTHVYTYGLEAASGCGYLTVTMRAKVPIGGDKYKFVEGTHSGIRVCGCREDECGECDDSAIAFNLAVVPDTIAQNGSAAIAITDSLGTGGPYDWAVSGTGFTLDYAQTAGLTNVLRASGSACGTAVITVTGCDGTVITETVRCTTGAWEGTPCATTPAYPTTDYLGTCYSGYVNSCAAGGFMYGRTAGAGGFNSGCAQVDPPEVSCNYQVYCAAMSTYLSVEKLADDPRSACDFGGELCADSANSAIYFKYWRCA